jgi:hypothetical protein
MKRMNWLGAMLLLGGFFAIGPARASAAETTTLPPYLYDRGEGIHTSMFGIYVRDKEFLFYPFYEYTRFSNFEYKPSDFGVNGDQDFFGKAVQNEYLVFFAYGLSDSLMVEFESALYSSISFDKAPDDTSPVPNHLRESGLGDTEGQIRWRWLKETERRPEVLFSFETAFPLQKDRKLLGTQYWEFKPGVTLTKGYAFGTLSLEMKLAYTTEEHTLEFGEYTLEYVKKTSDAWRFVLAFEGEQDELQLIGEAQYTLSKNAVLKLNCGFGITKKAPDISPEVGVVFAF